MDPLEVTLKIKAPRKGFIIPNTDLAPFVLCELCTSMQTHGNVPHEPLITSLSKFRGPPECCGVRRYGTRSPLHDHTRIIEI
jgi:hypothetical protein